MGWVEEEEKAKKVSTLEEWKFKEKDDCFYLSNADNLSTDSILTFQNLAQPNQKKKKTHLTSVSCKMQNNFV